MAQYITLEEAANKLGIPADEFKRRLKTEWTHVVPMRDGPTLRFRTHQVEELARQLGAASDPGLPLADPIHPTPGSDDYKVPVAPRGPADEPLDFGGSDDDIFSLTDDPGGKWPKKAGDSDVRLEAAGPRSRPPEQVPTEELSLDVGGPGSAVIKGGGGAKLTPPKSSGKLSAPDSGKKLSGGPGGDSGKNLAAPGGSGGDSSEFELSLDADSDDFELRLNADSSDEVDLGSSPVEAAGGGGKSGINLRDPKDSGIPLDAGKKPAGGKAPPPADSDPDLDFELTLDPGPAGGKGKGKAGGPKSGPKAAPVTSDSDSEFELTLDGSSGSGSSLESAALESAEANKGDIFETDFEIPPMADESGSEAVAVDSDTDLEADDAGVQALADADAPEDETGSQVVVIEDESDVVSSAVEEEIDVLDEPAPRSSRLADEPVVVQAPPAKPRPWGIVPVLILFPTVILTLLGGMMAYELLKSATGYQQARRPAAPLVRGVASALDMEPKDQ
ncbi:MAG: hypothetical protein K2X87_18325 [Gemmataceae bacterium]|nr:hypothetical protein [Gemmataceae bacterium]